MPQIYEKVWVDKKTKLLHRHLMEQLVGRELLWDEVVHHKNGNKLDNRIENLEIMSRAEHQKHHNQKHPYEKNCCVCDVVFTPKPTKRKSQKTCSKACHSILKSRIWSTITDQQVVEIKALYDVGDVTQQQLADKYGTTRSNIGHILLGRSRAIVNGA